MDRWDREGHDEKSSVDKGKRLKNISSEAFKQECFPWIFSMGEFELYPLHTRKRGHISLLMYILPSESCMKRLTMIKSAAPGES